MHEWAHLRWGVYDEYNEEKPFYLSNGRVEYTRLQTLAKNFNNIIIDVLLFPQLSLSLMFFLSLDVLQTLKVSFLRLMEDRFNRAAFILKRHYLARIASFFLRKIKTPTAL